MIISSLGTLNLGNSDETVGGFAINGGILNGTGGTLTTSVYGLNGGGINGNLGTGTLKQFSNITVLNGTSAAGIVDIDGGTLTLGTSNRLSDSAVLTVTSPGILNLGSSNDTISSFILNGGILDGSGTLTAATYTLKGGIVNANLGNGILTQLSNSTLLNGTSTAGTVAINGGTLTLGASNRLADGAAVTVNGAILDLGTFSDSVTSFVLNGGNLDGTGKLTAATYVLKGGNVNANLGGGTLTQISGETVLTGNSDAAIVTISGGTLTLGTSDRLDDSAAVTLVSILDLGSSNDSVGTFTLNSGILNGTGTLTAASYALNGGTVNANLGLGTLNQISSTTLLRGASAAGIVNVNGGTLTLGGSNRLANGAALTVASVLDLASFSDTVGSFALNGGTLDGTGTLTAATYSLKGGMVKANLGAGTLISISGTTVLEGASAAGIVSINGGTLSLGAADRLANTAAVTLNSAILNLGGFNDTVGTFTLNAGTLAGTGTLTATTYALNGGILDANLGSGTLNQLANATQLNGTSAAGIVNVTGGTLTLGGSDRLANTADLTITSPGTLDLGIFNDTVGRFVLNGGKLSGSGTLTAATYGLNGGQITANLGSGTLNQFSNTTILDGTSAAGIVAITGGTLSLGASDRLANNAAVTISSLGTLNLGTASDTVGSFVLNGGILDGSGTLTAATYGLNGGTVIANLGAGILNQTGGLTQLNGSSAAAIVNINGGTLTLGSSDRLANNAALTIASLGTLNLGNSSDSVGSFVLNGGILNGSGTLTAATYGLNGGTINGNLGAGTLNQLSNVTTLNGTSSASIVNISGGTLTLGASDRLDDNAAVTVAGILNLGNFSDTIGSLTMAGGTINGSGILTAGRYDLNGIDVNANLGSGTLNQVSGFSVLNGTSAASSVNVHGGTLTLGASDRLADNAAVTVVSILDLGTSSDTVGTFTLNSGTLNGSGTLTAASYALNGGTVNGNLGLGTLNQLSNSTLLNGTSAAGTVNINGGQLTLGGSNRLADGAALTVNAAILDLATHSDTVGSFVLNGGTLNGSGTLTAATYGLNGGTLNANLGLGTLNQLSGITILNGSSEAGIVNLNGGQLNLGASDRLANNAAVTLNSAILNLGGFSDTVGSFTLNGGSLNGSGTLTTTTYALNGGTLNANLGTGILNQLSNTTVLLGTSSAGTVNVNGGTLALGASDRLINSSAVTISGGTLDLGGFNDIVATFALNSGNLNGSGTLTAATYALNGGTINANLGSGTLNQLSNTTVLLGTSSAGTVAITGGTLSLGASDRLANNAAITISSLGTLNLGTASDTVGSLVLNGGTLTGSGTLTAATYALNGGNVNANLGAGILNQTGGTTILNGSSAAATVNVNGGTLTLGSSDRLANNAALTLASLGTLNLGNSSDTVGSFVLNGGTLNGSGTLTAATYGLNGGTINGNLGAGTLTQLSNVTTLNGTSSASIVNISGGTLKLGASDRLDDSAAVTIAGILDLGNFSDTVGSLTMAGGTINGSGILTAGRYDLNGINVNANLGAGTLNQVSGSSVLNGTSAATSVNVNGGTLTLGASDRLANNAALTVNAATLDMSTFQDRVGSFTLNGGTIAGGGTLSATTYALNGGNVNANLGEGVLTQLSGTTVLSGTSYALAVNIDGGTLTLGASNRLANTADVTVASAGTLNLGNANDTVRDFTLNGGTLNGTGTLSASHYYLHGGTVNGNLGNNSLIQLSNTTVLNGTSTARSVNVDGGALVLGGSDRLLNIATVTVNGGSLALGSFDDTVGSFRLTGGSIDGTGTFTATSYFIDGGTVNANLGTGVLTAKGGLLNGTSAANDVNVRGGTLTLGASDRLADHAVVTLDSAVLDLGSFNETVAGLIFEGGTLNGSGTLTAENYNFNGGRVNANLGAGSLNQRSGDTILAGTSAATLVDMTGGQLHLAAAHRLDDTADVVIGSGATLDLGVHSDTVGMLILNGGIVDGTGTLTASTYSLSGGTVNANLGRGAISQLFGENILNGRSEAKRVEILGGTLHLGAADRLEDHAEVTISSASRLNLGLNDETVASLVLSGGTLDGSGTLTAAAYSLTGGSVNSNLGNGILSQLFETTTLNGTASASQIHVVAGTLVLGSSDRLADNAKVAIERAGRLDLGSATETVGSFTLNAGRLVGNGTLTATSYNLNGGVVDANLGAGTLNQVSRTTTLNGSSAANSVNVTSGTLTLGTSNRLSDNANVSVNAAGLNLGTSSDTIRSLSVQSGSILGNGTLTAGTYTLDHADIVANLGTGKLQQIDGISLLKGTSSAANVEISGGVLRLMGKERLSDRATVRVVRDGKLKVRGAGETVSNYFQKGTGKLFGSGDLKVTGLARLSGGNVSGSLVGDALILGDVKVTGEIGGGFVRVKKGELDLRGTLDSDTRVGGKGGLLATGRITGNLKNFGALAVGSIKKGLKISGDLFNKGTITLSLKDLSKFQSIKANAMKFGGTLVVVNDGTGLKRRQAVQLFKAGSYSGEFDSVVTVGFDNRLVFDAATGTLRGTGKLVTKPKKSSKSKAAATAPASASALLAPTTATAHPIKGIEVIGGRKFRTLTISRTPGVEVSSSDIQVSSDRLEWSSGKRHLTVLRDDRKTLVVRDNSPVTQDNKRFIRLKR